MRRRAVLGIGVGLAAVAGCSVLPTVPYTQRRDWPILVPRPDPLPLRAHGPVLLVRTVTAAPGLDRRGLQTMLPDGSMHVDFYEQWAVAPADGVEAALQAWLAGSGLYSAVIGSGSRLSADLVLEGTLTALWGDPAAGHADAALALVLLDQRRGATKVRLQQTITGQAPLTGADAPAVAHATLAALADVFAQATQALAGVR
jgi:cholesterol transport system auxiliary component